MSRNSLSTAVGLVAGMAVEVAATTSDTKLSNSDSFRWAIGLSTHEKATLTVSAAKMIGKACP